MPISERHLIRGSQERRRRLRRPTQTEPEKRDPGVAWSTGRLYVDQGTDDAARWQAGVPLCLVGLKRRHVYCRMRLLRMTATTI